VPQSFTDFDVFRTGTTELLTAYVRDPKTEELTDVIGTSTFNLIDIEDDSVKYTTTFNTDGGTGILHPSTGIYQFSFDTTTYPDEYIAAWRCVLESEVVTNQIFIKSEPSKMFARAAALRVQVDKARKSVSDDIENMDKSEFEPAVQLFYGYDDKHLIYYLERGAQFINLVPPYTALTPITFPWAQYGMILTDAAVIAALESQGIFAIDTDYNYSLGGNSLVIDHYTKISGLLGTLITRFDTNVVRFKQQFRSKGMVVFQWMPGGVRAARQLSAMPSGFWSRMLSSAFV
jgi:hypothetical protein